MRLPIALFSFFFYSLAQGSIWHISLNSTDDFLCVCTTQHLRIYSAAQLVAGSADPLVELEMDMVSRLSRSLVVRAHRLQRPHQSITKAKTRHSFVWLYLCVYPCFLFALAFSAGHA